MAAIVTVIVVLVDRDDHPYDDPVAESTLQGFPTRGPLADEDDLVEAAADVWREADTNRADTKPPGAIELLWAGEVDTEAIDSLVTHQDTPTPTPPASWSCGRTGRSARSRTSRGPDRRRVQGRPPAGRCSS